MPHPKDKVWERGAELVRQTHEGIAASRASCVVSSVCIEAMSRHVATSIVSRRLTDQFLDRLRPFCDLRLRQPPEKHNTRGA
jgi:hypothetical protein